jgi:hypothetical protein
MYSGQKNHYSRLSLLQDGATVGYSFASNLCLTCACWGYSWWPYYIALALILVQSLDLPAATAHECLDQVIISRIMFS